MYITYCIIMSELLYDNSTQGEYSLRSVCRLVLYIQMRLIRYNVLSISKKSIV